ncbi:Rieske 2Fe-2S domain-containing protein (plasmid) [Streptomyces sp. BI20]|uniref:Rieske 2Fe-2S domain-containing protein n=1 Tax=Streptomyces sp. BI20 TaxID=3403460 RepID=UPI003C714EC4
MNRWNHPLAARRTERRERREAREQRERASPAIPYPNGWFGLADAGELRPGRVLTRRLMDEDVVLYRTAGGTVRAVRPFCPHLGAHLGHGGTVVGETIRCPFHHFRFGPDGTCVATGYGTPPPPKARVAPLECREVDGFVMVWWHARGEAPSWEIEPLAPGEFEPPRSHVIHLRDHPQDVYENVFDQGHFAPVHGVSATVTRPAVFEGTRAGVSMRYTPGQGVFVATAGLAAEMTVSVQGMGFSRTETRHPVTGVDCHLWGLATPIGPGRLALRVAVSARPTAGRAAASAVNRLTAKALLRLLAWDIRRDGRIWSNKIHLEHPKLAEGDGPILQYRDWARQFYTEG